jgi:integrase
MVAFMTSLFCAGLRMSEARAWRWEDIDLEANTFQVVRAVKDRQGSIADPKWDKRREGLQLPSVLKSALVAWRSELEEQFTGYVFPDLNGEPVSETVVRRAWRRMLSNGKVDAGERWLKPHSARHSLNTHLLAARVPALDVQLYLGWQSQEAKVLTRVQENYTHMQLLSTVSVADAVDRLYGPAPASSEQQQQK